MAQAMGVGAADPVEEVLVAALEEAEVEAVPAVVAPEGDSTIIYGKDYTIAANWLARWESLAE